MAKAPYLGKKGTVDLDDEIFGEDFHMPVVHETVRAELNARRQGTVKRHNFSRGPVTHGSHNVRAPGSIGASATPSRVFKGIRGPGQMGNKRVTQKGLEVVDVLPDRNLLLLRGSVPGPKGSTVEIRTDS
jgi:hypothetical protein